LRQIIAFAFKPFDFDALSSREPASTPGQVRGNASLENASPAPRRRRRQAEAAAETAVETGRSAGWVERSDTHQWPAQKVMGFASLYPSYG
jgi:hypothetical protein